MVRVKSAKWPFNIRDRRPTNVEWLWKNICLGSESTNEFIASNWKTHPKCACWNRVMQDWLATCWKSSNIAQVQNSKNGPSWEVCCIRLKRQTYDTPTCTTGSQRCWGVSGRSRQRVGEGGGEHTDLPRWVAASAPVWLSVNAPRQFWATKRYSTSSHFV